MLRLVIAVVCQQYEFELSDQLSVRAGPTLSVDESLELELETL